MSRLNVAVKLSRRQATRRAGRTIAIILTLMLPIGAATAVDLVLRTTHLSASESAARMLGGARAQVGYNGTGIPPSSVPAGLLPPGAVQTPDFVASVDLVSDQSAQVATVEGVDLTTPALAPLYRVHAGVRPTGPGEISLSPSLAKELHATVGTVLHTLQSPEPIRVTGIISLRYSPRNDWAYTTWATARALAPVASGGGNQTWFVTSSRSLTQSQADALGQGVFWVVTDNGINPQAVGPLPTPPAPHTLASQNAASARVSTALLVAMVLLEVVLLAGPAFAVGAKRRRRELATIAAAGASRSQIMLLAVSDGLVLGVVAAVLAVAVGVTLGAVILAGLPSWTGQVPGAFDFRPFDIAGLALLGVLSGVLAAAAPALAASRQDTAQVLRGHRQPAPLPWWPPVAGLVILAAGAALGFVSLDKNAVSGPPLLLVLSAVMAEVGLVLLTPALLVAVGSLARWLPVSGRLALRDASRQRTAAAPGGAAWRAVVAATATVLVYGASVASHDRATYQPFLTVGDGIVYLSAGFGAPAGASANAEQILARVQSDLPGAEVVPLRTDQCGSQGPTCRQVGIVPPATTACPAITYQFDGDGSSGFSASGVGCISNGGTPLTSYYVNDGPGMATILGGPAGQAAAAALAEGMAVVPSASYLDHGKVDLQMGPGQPTRASIPAIAVTSALPNDFYSVILPPSVATSLHLDASGELLYIKHADRLPTPEVRAVNEDMARMGFSGGLDVETGFHTRITTALWVFTAADVFLVVGAAVAATLLIGVDFRDEVMTLAALGAGPRARRRLAMARAAVICALGAVLGTVAGLVPGIALVWRLRHLNSVPVGLPVPAPLNGTYPLSLPWGHLAIVALATPVIAMLAAGVMTRVRLPAERRII